VPAFAIVGKRRLQKNDAGVIFAPAFASPRTDMALVDTPAAGSYRPVTPKLDWPHAIRSVRRLLKNKEDTVQVDDAWLDSLPEGSVGAAYRDFVRAERLSAEGLAEVSRQGAAQVDEQHPYAWFGRRTRDVHDIWHILSGYGRDGLGEACLVAFSYAQTKGLGWALIAVAAALRSRSAKGHPYTKAIWQGYRRGKAAAWLLGEDYDRLMAEPLESARRRLNITPPTVYDAIPADARDSAVPAR
jgi:ubiquinone biosynthesis protein COQ4